LKEIKEDNPLVLPGGYFKPKFCTSRSKVCQVYVELKHFKPSQLTGSFSHSMLFT